MEWISVEERLPPAYELVEIKIEMPIWVGRMDLDGCWISRNPNPEKIGKITHWRHKAAKEFVEKHEDK